MITLNDPWQVLALGLTWLFPVPELIILMVCWVNRRLSRWMWLVMAGFGLFLASQAGRRVLGLLLRLSVIQLPDHPAGEFLFRITLATEGAAVAALLLLACGLALVFRDLKQHLKSYQIAILRLSRDKG